MDTLHFETVIDARVKKVWGTMLDDTTFRQWTSAFMEENAITKVSIAMNSAEEHQTMFQEAWPKGLENLKQLAEKQL